MITDEQKREIKKRANLIKFRKKKNRFQKDMIDNFYLIDSFEDTPNLEKYKKIKRYTEE